VNMTVANLTYYFKRKDDLAVACYRYAFGLLGRIVADAQRKPTPTERLRQFVQRLFALQQEIVEGKASSLLDFGYIHSLSDPQRSEMYGEYKTYFRSVRRLIRPDHLSAKNSPELDSNTLYLVSQINWFCYWLGLYQEHNYDRIADRMFDILAFGIGCEGFGWSEPAASDFETLSKPKQAFLKAATELINRSGYRGASVERIADRMGRTKGSFYHHYKNKDELVSACYDRTFALIDSLLDRVGKTQNHRDQLNGAISNLVRFQLDPAGPLLHTSGLTALAPGMRSRIEDKFRQLADGLSDMIIDGIIDGSVRPVDPIIGAQMLIPTIFSASELLLWFPGFAGQHNAAGLYVRPFFKGILQR
jgi:AcrR family transcriptional regulator